MTGKIQFQEREFHKFKYLMLKNFEMQMCGLLVFLMLVNDQGGFADY